MGLAAPFRPRARPPVPGLGCAVVALLVSLLFLLNEGGTCAEGSLLILVL